MYLAMTQSLSLPQLSTLQEISPKLEFLKNYFLMGLEWNKKMFSPLKVIVSFCQN